MTKFIRVLPVLIILIFSGCKKDDPLTPAQLLSGTTSNGKTWQLTEQSLDGTVTAIASCSADDLTTFFPAFDFSFDEGSLKCDTSDPQNLSGTWILDQNDTHLLVTIGTDIIDYEVLTLTENSLSLKTTILEFEVITVFSPR